MRILLPIDGSELALHEVRFAIRLVQDGLRADFLLTNVQEPASLYEMVVVPDPEALGTISHDAGEHILQEACRLLDAHGLAYETEIVTGDPVQATGSGRVKESGYARDYGEFIRVSHGNGCPLSTKIFTTSGTT